MSVWAVGIFRFGKWAQAIKFRPLRRLLLLIYFLSYKLVEALSGIRISIDSEIGPGLVIHNFGGVVIHGRLGRNCTIVQGAQLISRSDGKQSGWPILGDAVFVGSGAKIVGNIKIGNNVKVGANAVVAADVPDDCIVLAPECIVLAQRRDHGASDGNQHRAHIPAEGPHSVLTDSGQLLRETFQLLPDYPLGDDVALDELPGWDSLNYLRLVIAIESRLGRKLDLDETAGLISTADVQRLLHTESTGQINA